MEKKKIIRITTVPGSLATLLKGQLKYVSEYFNIVAISSLGVKNQLQSLSENENVRTINIEMTRKITPFKDILAVVKLYNTLKKERPFIVHSHTPKAGTIGMIASKLAGVPNRLHTVAGLPLVESKGLKRKILIAVEKITYACATKVYPNSYGLKDIIIKEKITEKSKINVIANGSSNGIDTTFFNVNHFTTEQNESLKNELNIKTDDFVFIFVGRLVKDKGINELVASFEKLLSKHNNLKLLLVGGFEKELDPLKAKTIKAIKTNANIITTGWVTDVRPYFAISNLLVFPSYREGFPNVVMQACAMKLASIVSDINGCNEIIQQEKSGLIIPKKDEQALYNAMEYMLSNKQKLNTMGKNARNIVVDNYEQRLVWQAVLAEYKALEA